MVFTWYWAHIFSSDLVIILGGCIFSSWIWDYFHDKGQKGLVYFMLFLVGKGVFNKIMQ
jgi:hypothetical protein